MNSKEAGIYLSIFSAIVLILFELVPAIVFLVIGVRYFDDPCNDFTDPSATWTLSKWLVEHGAIGVFSFVVDILSNFLVFVKKLRVLWMIIVVVHYLMDLVFIAFLIIGAVVLSDDEACQVLNPTLYNTALAAVIIGFGIEFVFAGSFTAGIAINYVSQAEEEEKTNEKSQGKEEEKEVVDLEQGQEEG